MVGYVDCGLIYSCVCGLLVMWSWWYLLVVWLLCGCLMVVVLTLVWYVVWRLLMLLVFRFTFMRVLLVSVVLWLVCLGLRVLGVVGVLVVWLVAMWCFDLRVIVTLVRIWL